MPQKKFVPMERKLGISKAREHFAELVEQAQYQGDAVITSRNGKPAALVVPIEIYQNWKKQRSEFFDRISQTQQRVNLDPGEAEQLAAEAVSAARK